MMPLALAQIIVLISAVPSLLAFTMPGPMWQPLSLPRELVDIIVSNMDKADLAVCTLLSHHWRVSALPFLFRTIVVRSCDNSDHWSNAQEPQYGWNHDHPPSDSSEFYRFLSSEASSHLRPHVRSLTLAGDDYTMMHFPLSIFELDNVLNKLPALETLRLRCIELKLVNLFTPHCWSSPRSLQRLQLDDVDLEPPSWVDEEVPSNVGSDRRAGTQCCLVELLNLFSDVQVMEITDVTFGWKGGQTYHGHYLEHPDLSVAAGSRINATFHCHELICLRQAAFSRIGDVPALLSVGLKGLSSLTFEDNEPLCHMLLGAVGAGLEWLHLVLHIEPIGDMSEVRCITAVFAYMLMQNLGHIQYWSL